MKMMMMMMRDRRGTLKADKSFGGHCNTPGKICQGLGIVLWRGTE